MNNIDNTLSDKELMIYHRNGNKLATSMLYTRYFGLGKDFALKFCKDHHKSKDISQDAMINVLNTLEKKRETELEDFNFRNYFFRAVRNNSLKDIMNGKRREEVLTRYTEESAMENNNPSIEEDMTKEEKKKIAIERVNRLPKNQRTCFMLQLANHSYAEIAELLEKTEDQVRGLLDRARRNLRPAL